MLYSVTRRHPGRIFASRALLACLLAALACAAARPALAQARAGSIAGDLKVAGAAQTGTPLTFDVILYFLDGRIHSRDKVSAGGRYRFISVPVGEYDIVVEMDGQEVARLRVNVISSGTIQDIELAWRGAGAAAPARKQTVSAEDFYDRPAANQPTFKKAQEAVDKKTYEQAAALLKQVVGSDEKDFQAWTELGTVYLLLKKDSDAERAYESAIKARPGFFLAQINLGRLRASQKKFAEAVEPLARAVELQPANAEAHFLLGESYLQTKQGSKAVGHLNEAARLGRSEAHLRLATLYNAVGAKDRAAAEYEQFLAKNPDHPEKKKLQQYISENKKQ